MDVLAVRHRSFAVTSELGYRSSHWRAKRQDYM